MPNVDLTNPDTIRDLLSIQRECPGSDISIFLAQLDEEPQWVRLSASHPLHNLPRTRDLSMSTQGPFPQATVPGVLIGTHDTMEAVHAVGSYTKVVIAYAMACLLELYKDFTWNSLAEDVFNILQEKADGEDAPRIELCGKPTLMQLLCHKNSFAPMNKILFAPDGTFLLNKEAFLRIAPRFTKDYYTNHAAPWYAYSNANYIFAGIIIEMGMGMDLEAALKELVFEKLGMRSTTIDQDRLNVFRTSHKIVDGFQISSNGEKIPVISGNLLQDSIESSSMGLRTSLEDLFSFNMELLPNIDADRNLIPVAKGHVPFFFGNIISFAGFVSHPMEGEFQMETPTQHLYPDGYKSTHLGKQQRLAGFRAHLGERSTKPTDDKTITGTITHKAGYIDGYSSNVIVFPKERDVLIILANSTGPFDLVHHISRYLLQEKLDLKPRISIILEDARDEHSICSEFLQELERRNLAQYHENHRPGKIAGTYTHTKWEQQITIEPNGGVFFHHVSGKRSRTAMVLTFISDNTIRILLKSKALALEGWSVWQNMDFIVDHRDGHDCLIHNDERYVNANDEVVVDVYRKEEV